MTNTSSYLDQIKSVSDILTANFIGVAIYLDKETGSGYHSGLIVCADHVNKIVHYTGTSIEIQEINDIDRIVFIKELEIINPEEAVGFLAHCEIIQDSANPEYDFVFDGSYYNILGEYYSTTDLGERYTCVGFCINVITGFMLEVEKYFELTDWSNDDPKANEYFEKFSKTAHGLDLEKVKQHFKRVTPNQYFTSAYFNTPPIRKAQIDEIIEAVSNALIKRLKSMPQSQ